MKKKKRAKRRKMRGKLNYFAGIKAGFLTGFIIEFFSILISYTIRGVSGTLTPELIVMSTTTLILSSLFLSFLMGMMFIIFGVGLVFLSKYIPTKNFYYKSILYFILIELVIEIFMNSLNLGGMVFSVFYGIVFAFLYKKLK